MSDTSRKWTGKTGGGNFGLGSLIFMLKFIPLRFFYFCVALSVPFYIIFKYKAARSIYRFFHLRLHFSKSKSICYTFINHYRFGQTMMDRLSVMATCKCPFKFEVEGKSFIENAINQPKGFIIGGSHIGNFEIGGYFLYQEKKQINTIVFDGENKVLQKHRKTQFAFNNVNMVPVKKDLSHLFIINQALNDGNIVSLPCDRIFGSTKFVSTQFLGATANFPIGAFQIAAIQQVNLYALFVMKEKKSVYRVIIIPIQPETSMDAHPKQIAERMALLFVENMEKIVKRYPEQWFNYYDFWNDNI